MIDISQIKAMQLFKNKTVLTSTDIIIIKNSISQYKYPVGVIPSETIESNKLYESASIEENLKYFNSSIPQIFSDVYSQEEINIINAYLLTLCESQFIISKELEEFLLPYTHITSDKVEIQYYIDEIKYKYLKSLIYSGSSNTDTISTLINELQMIEEAHNTFNVAEYQR